jgi:GTP-binding protein EngB required for normal cell division
MCSKSDGKEHTATIYAENSRCEGVITCCGGHNPSAEDLDDFGTRIKRKITEQQSLVLSRKPDLLVTDEKVIVRLNGPRFPNLSLVDLPGLRQRDDAAEQGLKEAVRKMVEGEIRSKNSVLLAVGMANASPSTWVGHGLAQEFDRAQTRTTVVVTKCDKLFGGRMKM